MNVAGCVSVRTITPPRAIASTVKSSMRVSTPPSSRITRSNATSYASPPRDFATSGFGIVSRTMRPRIGRGASRSIDAHATVARTTAASHEHFFTRSLCFELAHELATAALHLAAERAQLVAIEQLARLLEHLLLFFLRVVDDEVHQDLRARAELFPVRIGRLRLRQHHVDETVSSFASKYVFICSDSSAFARNA